MTKNEKIKRLIAESRLYHYEIATLIGIREETFCKWFRSELTDEQEAKILNAISLLKGEILNATN